MICECASNRWLESALLTQTKSRIGHKYGMRERRGLTRWAPFVQAVFKADSLRAIILALTAL